MDKVKKVLVTVTPQELAHFKKLQADRESADLMVKALLNAVSQSTLELNYLWDDIARKYGLNRDRKMLMNNSTGGIAYQEEEDKFRDLLKKFKSTKRKDKTK